MLQVLFLFAIIIEISWGQSQILYEGERCPLDISANLVGTCRKQSECPGLQADFQRGKHIQICSFDGREPVVCCPTDKLQPSSTNRNKRIHEQKCKEYADLAVKTVEVISLALQPSVNKISVSECEDSVPLIVGGMKAKKGEFPHMAAIGWTKPDGTIDWQCGGAIVSERWLISAAHCKLIDRVAPDVVRLGSQRLSQPDSDYDDYAIDQLLTSPAPQNYLSNSRYNDILLVRVSQSIVFHMNLRPVCLWGQDEITSATALASGWGKMAIDAAGSDDLLKVSLNIYNNSVCANKYGADRRLRQGIIDSQICAGALEGGKDTCQGDSGSPLQITLDNNNCVYYIVGVTSFGKGCALAETPAVYTRVSSYIDWIESVVWN